LFDLHRSSSSVNAGLADPCSSALSNGERSPAAAHDTRGRLVQRSLGRSHEFQFPPSGSREIHHHKCAQHLVDRRGVIVNPSRDENGLNATHGDEGKR